MSFKPPAPKVMHKPDCGRVFKRYDLSCPRCCQLAEGFAPRQGWFNRAGDDAKRSAEIKAHFTSDYHREGKCGPVCTFGDW